MNLSRLGKWTFPVLIVLVTLVIASLLMATKPEAPTRPSTEKAWQVSATTAERESVRPEIELYARSESPFLARLSTTLSADVVELAALAGQSVAAGETIIQLDDTDAQLALMQAEADVAELEARIQTENNRFAADQRSLASEQRMLEIANQALARQKRLEASQLVAQERKETAESAAAQAELMIAAREQSINDHPARLKQLKALLKRANARLALAKRDLDKTRIVAPFDARIIAIHTAPGDRVQAGQTLVEVYDQSRVELRAQIPNSMLEAVENAFNQNQAVLAFAGNTKFKLNRLAGSTSDQHGGRDAWFIPVDANASLVINRSLRLIMQLPQQDALIALPLSAIYGTNRVFRIVDERLESLNVQVVGYRYGSDEQAASQTRDHVLIRSNAIQDGDQIITTQLPKAINGLKVFVPENQVNAQANTEDDA